MRRSGWWTLVALGMSGPAFGFGVEVPRPQLCAWSDLAVVAEVGATEVRWAQGPRGDLETVADLSVVRTVHGAAPADVFVRAPGGRMGSLVQRVEDAATLAVGARYLLLLRRAPDGDGWIVVGGEAGAIRLADAQTRGEREADAVASLGGCRAR